jgi:CheY-like chemotaxis protein
MVSSSNQQPDVDRAYQLGASAYIVKPCKLEDFQNLFRVTGEFFLEHAEKPTLSQTRG